MIVFLYMHNEGKFVTINKLYTIISISICIHTREEKGSKEKERKDTHVIITNIKP